jgi:two-component system, chemotaxis family, CheB/CheR fusion protein
MSSKKSRSSERQPQSFIPDTNPGKEESHAQDRNDEESSDSMGAASDIPVVGIGGSAGALDCFKTFFEAMPLDSGVAFVVIQHLAPAYESLLTELLAAHTCMKVTQAGHGAAIKPNCVYVIPPNQNLSIRDGVLSLTEFVKNDGIRMPIDFFFRSLAEDRQERAIGVLFSGAGSDGTMGVRAIRGAGGLTIAQDPQTAQYGDMPRNAIATRLVDYVLQPDRIPQAIMDYLRQPYVRDGESTAMLDVEGQPGGFSEVLAIVKAQTDCDFRCYKKNTILRRIERQMGLHHISDIAKYCDLLRQNAGEVSRLQKDLLINVTAFFRDAGAFEELLGKVILPMIEAKQTDDPVRVWIPGCASGEEAYSIAMLLTEAMTAARKVCPVQIFATDIDEDALEFARQGIYPESIVADVGSERVTRFFVRKERGYQVRESLRSMVVFAAQNLIAEPPFSKMDLIACRNLLIYLDIETQTKLIPLFNFALNPGGCLFLGMSEGVGGQADLFIPISKKAKLFRRLTPSRPVLLDTPIVPGRKKAFPISPTASRLPGGSYADAIRQALLGHFAASVVLVDRKGQILQFHGQTGNYLNMPTGEPNLNLMDTAKEGLSLRLRSALHSAINEGKPVVLEPPALTSEDGSAMARVTVTPVRRREAEPLLAVIFEDVPRPAIAGITSPPATGSEKVVRQLEDELRATQQDLQASIEELQAANEELRISNEEVVSTNEELQSTNEELETSKEELQSINEELTTVNAQLQEKAERLVAANRDISNLLKSTRIATLFLDSELRIRFFTPTMSRILNLIYSDVGRPIGDLSSSLTGCDLAADILAVSKGCPVVERDIRHADGSFFRMRIMPYQEEERRTEGVVATFEDVTQFHNAQERTRRLATVVRDSNDAVILFDLDGHIQAWNHGAQVMYGWSEEEALQMALRELLPPEPAVPFIALFQRVAVGETISSLETQRCTKDGRVLDVWLTITAVVDEFGKIVAIATTERDVTERKKSEDEHQHLTDKLRTVLEAAPVAIWIAHDPMCRRITGNAYADELIMNVPRGGNISRSAKLGEAAVSYQVFRNGKELDSNELPAQVAASTGQPVTDQKLELVFPDGRTVHLLMGALPLFDAQGRVLGSVATGTDITRMQQAEEALRQSEEQLRLAQESANVGVWDWNIETGLLNVTPELDKLYGLASGTMKTYQNWRERVHPDDIGRIETLRDEAIVRHEPFDMEFRGRHSSGGYRWISTKGGAIYNMAGKAIRMFGVNIDITARKQVEEALRQSRAELEQRVQDRTKELSQTIVSLNERSDQLRRMTAELTLAEQRERRRLAQILHDGLQQILVGAKYQLATLPRSRNVAKTTHQVAKFIDDAIETSRSLTAEISPPILLQGDLILALEWLARWMHDRYGLNIKLIVPEKIEAMSEELMLLLFQATRELLFNVVKHAGVTAARIGVSRPDGLVVMTIDDEGSGFDPNRLAESDRSSGMGLFGIRERLSYLGGRMEIDSAPGQGSQFKLIVPHTPAAAEMKQTAPERLNRAPVAVSAQAQTGPADAVKRIRILLVDDHLIMRQGLAALLHMDPDFEIVGEASDGESAMSLVRELKPDVVLMDIGMPRMDGVQATRIIHKEFPEIRIIGLSMFQEGEQQAAMREAGAVDYLTKTGPCDALINTIRACVQVKA